MASIRYVAILLGASTLLAAAEVVSFQNGRLILHGVLYRPAGQGPFPAVVYNHGSAPDNSAASEALGPIFANRGWTFFMPHRRGQGLSASAGPYIRDEIVAAGKNAGIAAATATMIRLLQTDHLSDQMAAADWLRKQAWVKPDQIAVAGNSFGGIETVLGAERWSYCAAVDVSGAAESWAQAPDLRSMMIRAVRNSRIPVFFIQPENDFDLSPTRTLSAEMKHAGKPYQVKIYPPFGGSAQEGHSFAYRGASVWADDVFRFLDQHCVPRNGDYPSARQAR
ncbi:MAG: prolyl oligopeptidase family serine peptidase [Acidobacteria bacterium]|nr:prolyl oligopeptidase family serine peptidase [Acidobacteriota bacterium]